MRRLSDLSLGGFVALALFFLYAPVVVLILFSFNDSRLMTLPCRASPGTGTRPSSQMKR